MWVVNGVRLFFFDLEGTKFVPEGPVMREKPTLPMLHGGPGSDHSIYRPAYSALADIAQIIYLDHRGDGRSEDGPRAEISRSGATSARVPRGAFAIWAAQVFPPGTTGRGGISCGVPLYGANSCVRPDIPCLVPDRTIGRTELVSGSILIARWHRRS